MVFVSGSSVDSGIEGKVLHNALEGGEHRLVKTTEGLAVAVECTLVVLDGFKAACDRGKVNARCRRRQTCVKRLVATRNCGDELLEGCGIPYLFEVVLLGRDIHHIVKLNNLAGGEGI